MSGPTPSSIRTSADLGDSSASGRAVLTGTPAQGATALGFGTGSAVTFGNVRTGGYLDFGYGLGIRVSPELAPTAEGGNNTWSSGTCRLITLTYSNGKDVVSLFTPGGSRSTAAMTLMSDGTVGVGTTTPGTTLDVAGPVRAATYTVTTLPAGVAGALIFVSNARKVGEAAGSGTGVVACHSNGAWRRLSDDTAVAA